MALGATRRNVFRGVLGNSLAIVLVGVAIGELLTVALNSAVASLQENIGPTPVSTHLAAGLIWLVVGLAASYVPAAQAARVDPLVALRDE
jgi:ABC-type antimicrobial peptide transport system permease subunit